MNYFFNFLVCMVSVILQTVIFPGLPLLDRMYDPVIPFVIFLGLYRPVPESLVTLLAVGLVMDGLSGGAVGLYPSAYLWIYLTLLWLVRYLHLVDSILLPFVVAAGVLLQNAVFGAATVLGNWPVQVSGHVLTTVGAQFLLAVGTGPFVLVFYKAANDAWQRWTGRWLIRRNGVPGR